MTTGGEKGRKGGGRRRGRGEGEGGGREKERGEGKGEGKGEGGGRKKEGEGGKEREGRGRGEYVSCEGVVVGVDILIFFSNFFLLFFSFFLFFFTKVTIECLCLFLLETLLRASSPSPSHPLLNTLFSCFDRLLSHSLSSSLLSSPLPPSSSGVIHSYSSFSSFSCSSSLGLFFSFPDSETFSSGG